MDCLWSVNKYWLINDETKCNQINLNMFAVIDKQWQKYSGLWFCNSIDWRVIFINITPILCSNECRLLYVYSLIVSSAKNTTIFAVLFIASFIDVFIQSFFNRINRYNVINAQKHIVFALKSRLTQLYRYRSLIEKRTAFCISLISSVFDNHLTLGFSEVQ